MKVFKIDVGNHKVHRLTLDNFNRETKKQAPWYQTTGSSEKWYAVCPSCDNPTVLVGMLVSEQPYARHHIPQPDSVSVPLKGIVDQDSMLFCPYYDKRQKITKTDRRKPDNPTALAIRKRVIEQFDRIVWFLTKTTGIRISKALAEQMLLDYQNTEGWLYRGATLSNVPWAFAYMASARRLAGRYITDTHMAQAICKNRPAMHVTEEGKLLSTTGYCDIQFAFTQHDQRLVDDELVETLTLDIFDSKGVVHTKKIAIETAWFDNLINSDNEDKRNRALLATATSMMGENHAR